MVRQTGEIARLATDVAAGRRLGGSVYARVAITKGAFASKPLHTFRVQAPYEGARNVTFDDIQATLNQLVFGSYYATTVECAQQPIADAGVGHINLRRHMTAEWAHLARQLADPSPAVWKNIWWRHIRDVYGPLTDRDLIYTRCTYTLLRLSAGPSQVQQLAMQAWGQLGRIPVFYGIPPGNDARTA